MTHVSTGEEYDVLYPGFSPVSVRRIPEDTIDREGDCCFTINRRDRDENVRCGDSFDSTILLTRNLCLRICISYLLVLTGCIAVFAVSGCATTGPYEFGQFNDDPANRREVRPVTVEYGVPNPTLDRIGNILSAPAKILTWHSKVDNHQISDETIQKLVKYMELNDILDVHVAVNDYSPREQWRRLRENQTISPGWKYTAGSLRWAMYTLRPGRIFGGSEYNPFTNTISIYSDVPAVLLAEAAYAKDIHSQKFPGMYIVLVNGLPIVSIWRQSRAVSDVIRYAQFEQDWEVERETYRVMYPRIGASAVSGAGMFATLSTGALSSIFLGPILSATGALAGHATGFSATRRREAELKLPSNSEVGSQHITLKSSGTDSEETITDESAHVGFHWMLSGIDAEQASEDWEAVEDLTGMTEPAGVDAEVADPATGRSIKHHK